MVAHLAELAAEPVPLLRGLQRRLRLLVDGSVLLLQPLPELLHLPAQSPPHSENGSHADNADTDFARACEETTLV